MASWQAHLLNGVLRFTMKRNGRKGIDINRARRTTYNPPARALHIPEGWRVDEMRDGGLSFDVAERDDQAGVQPTRIVLYLHGGGYFFGSPKTHRQIVIGLARVLSARSYALDYRLAPEHRFPAAYEDADVVYVKNREVRLRIADALRTADPSLDARMRGFESSGLIAPSLLWDGSAGSWRAEIAPLMKG